MIRALRLEPFEVTFGGAARDARGERRQTSGALLRLEAEAHSGCGELCPLPGRPGLELSPALEALRAIDVTGLPSPESVALEDSLRAIEGAGERLSPALGAARHALESALLDLFARHHALPAPEFLARALGRELLAEPLPLASLVDAADVGLALEQAQAASALGISTFKLKLSGAETDEAIAARVDALRAVFGRALRLRLDANQSLSARRALALAARLGPANLEFFEDPTRFGALAELAELGLPIAADEWLGDAAFDLGLAQALGGVRVLVLKPMVLGFMAALRLAERAALTGLAVVISHSFDGPCAMAAARSLALSLGRRAYADGLGPHVALSGWNLEMLPAHVRDGALVSWNRHGFGIGAT